MDWPRHPAESLSPLVAPSSLGLCYALMAAAAAAAAPSAPSPRTLI